MPQKNENLSYSLGLSELVLVVRDVPAAAKFYREIVGLIPHERKLVDWAWFWAGKPGESQRIALAKPPLLFEEHSPLPEDKRWGQVHFALHVPRENLDSAVNRVREKGVEVYGPKKFKWMKATAYYFYDLDGNLIEFWSPDLKSSE